MWRCVCVPLGPPCPCRGHLPELGPLGCREGDWAPDRNHSFALLSLGLEENEACFHFYPMRSDGSISSLLTVLTGDFFLGGGRPRPCSLHERFTDCFPLGDAVLIGPRGPFGRLPLPCVEIIPGRVSELSWSGGRSLWLICSSVNLSKKLC